MRVHTATVRGRRLTWDARELVRGGVMSDYIDLDLDDEYRACDRVVAVLNGGGESAPVRVEYAGEPFAVPSRLMDEAGPVLACLVGYAGGVQRVVSARETAPLCVVESGGAIDGDAPQDEAPDLWAQLMETVDEARRIAQSVRDDADAGKFDGEDGIASVDSITEGDIDQICR